MSDKNKIAKTNGIAKNKARTTIQRPCANCGKTLFITRYYQLSKNYKNYYCDKQCESSGRTKSRTIAEALKNATRTPNPNGYDTLKFQRKTYLVHRLIMEEHIGRELATQEQVHHMNGIRDDNRLENLMIVDYRNHDTETNKKIWKLQTRIRELEMNNGLPN